MAGRKISLQQMVAEVQWDLAISRWKNFNDTSEIRRLQAAGIKSRRGRQFLDGEIKRKRGRPGKLRKGPYPMTNEDVVQLVWMQKLRFGLPFTNNMGGPECNECFLAVAENHGVNVWQVREKWRRVPKEKRAEIHEWLKLVLAEEGYLHPRHQDD